VNDETQTPKLDKKPKDFENKCRFRKARRGLDFVSDSAASLWQFYHNAVFCDLVLLGILLQVMPCRAKKRPR
jgi:hypothetical protein